MNHEYIDLCIEYDRLLMIDFYGVAGDADLDRLDEVEKSIRTIEEKRGLVKYTGGSFYFDSY